MRNIRFRIAAIGVAVFSLGATLTALAVASLAGGETVSASMLFGPMMIGLSSLFVVTLLRDPSRRAELTTRPREGGLIRFQVGRMAPHTVVYRWDQMWVWLTVTVDGQLVRERWSIFGFRLVDVVEFEVGTDEKHHVRIEKRRPLFLSFSRPQPITAYIDGVAAEVDVPA